MTSDKLRALDDRLATAEVRGDLPGRVEDLLRAAVDTALTALGQQPLSPTITAKGLARLPLRILAAFRDRDRAQRQRLEALAAVFDEHAKYALDLDPFQDHASAAWERASARREAFEDAARELRAAISK